jgi:hypothetical protein
MLSGMFLQSPFFTKYPFQRCGEAFKEAQSEFLLSSRARALNWKQIPNMTYDEVAHVIGENLAWQDARAGILIHFFLISFQFISLRSRNDSSCADACIRSTTICVLVARKLCQHIWRPYPQLTGWY